MRSIKLPLFGQIVLISTFLVSGPALAEDMGQAGGKKAYMDADGDGVVTRQEFIEGHEKMFDRLDANGDGVIDADERRAHHRHKMGKRGKEGCRRYMDKSKSDES